MSAGFQLGAGILQGFFGVFQDMIGVLTIAVMGSEISSSELRLSGATCINNKNFTVFDGYSKSHENHLISILCFARTG